MKQMPLNGRNQSEIYERECIQYDNCYESVPWNIFNYHCDKCKYNISSIGIRYASMIQYVMLYPVVQRGISINSIQPSIEWNWIFGKFSRASFMLLLFGTAFMSFYISFKYSVACELFEIIKLVLFQLNILNLIFDTELRSKRYRFSHFNKLIWILNKTTLLWNKTNQWKSIFYILMLLLSHTYISSN